nr:uncharacterized protein I303_04528 [Kwoniella dejecticola CBS 10117]OBR85196.1 hypothetical protein I303_04528 [Kwoniella dejecticola CBS 10117]
MDSPATPSSPPTPASPDLVSEVDRLSLDPSSTSKLSQLDQVQVQAQAQAQDQDLDDDELEKFRNQWRAEVKAKRHDPLTSTTNTNGLDQGSSKRKEVDVGPVKWKGKSTTITSPKTQNTRPTSKPPSNAEQDRKTVGTAQDSMPKLKSNQAISPNDAFTSSPPTPMTASSSSKIQKPFSNGLNFKPGQAVDLDKLDSQLTSTTFSPFKPVTKPTRYLGSIAPDENGIVGGNDRERAISIYTKAIESEQAGKLNEALILYRKAFKLDDDVDRSYARSIKAKAEAEARQQEIQKHLAVDEKEDSSPNSADIISPTPPQAEPYSFARHIQVDPDYEKTHPSHLASSSSKSQTPLPALSPLTKLFNSLDTDPHQLIFVPEEEELPCPITKLPNELFEPILNHLDVASIERFGSSCWKARWLTHISHTWRNIAEKIYRPPAMLPPPPLPPQIVGRVQAQSPEDDDAQHIAEAEKITESQVDKPRIPYKSLEVRDLVSRHRNEWRTTVVEEERIRMDGCYIAVCHYIRPGAGDEWVTITHMITYHRFLRFYPDGNVISFLTTDHPSDIVPSLRPSMRGKGLHFGRWRLLRSDSPEFDENPNIVKLPKEEKGGKRVARVIISDLLEPGNESPKYEFEMELLLKSTGRGRWNKLEILEYRSINLLTGEVLALALKHQKPFYFSK